MSVGGVESCAAGKKSYSIIFLVLSRSGYIYFIKIVSVRIVERRCIERELRQRSSQ